VVTLAGCGSGAPDKSIRSVPASAQSVDIELLNRALDLEHETIAAYTAGIPLLYGRARKAAQQFLDQELSHAGELYGLIKQAKGKPNKPRPDYALGHPRSSSEVLTLVHELERRQLALYLSIITRLSPGSVRAAIGAVLGNDAQHVTILRSALHLPALPGPFVNGSE
jgi:rubrerythrin